jgi:general secretion pathway protein H
VRLIWSAGSAEARHAARRRVGERGFVLLEAIPMLIILVILTLLAVPTLPRATTANGLTALALQASTVLRTARTNAIAGGRPVSAVIDGGRRTITAGTALLELPSDVDLSVISAGSCPGQDGRLGIEFRPDGTSCGAVIRVARGATAYRLRVNWATAHVAVIKDG